MYRLRIRDLREDKGLNQTEIAKILHTNQKVYSRYETEERTLPLQHLITLAKYYNVTTDYILGITNKKSEFPKE